MTYLFPNYQRTNFEWFKGNGVYIEGTDGKQYLDFTSGIGVNNLGYNNQQLNQLLTQQATLLWHQPNLFQSSLQETVAEKLAFKNNYLTYFCNSGTEANEAAIKLARKATGKSKIITFINSFHGRTYGSMSATGQKKIQAGFQPLVPDFQTIPYNDLTAVKTAIDEQTAAVMLEIIQGEGGIIMADPVWLTEIATICHKKNCLLIIDEVQTGIGRTGSLYSFQQFNIEPDIITLAKGLGNGIPIGAMLGKDNLKSAFGLGTHGSTFGGNKLALNCANYVLSIVQEPSFLETVHKKGNYLKEQLKSALKNNAYVKEIRGHGLMIGIQLTEPDYLVSIVEILTKKGLLVLTAGNDVLRLLPPLIITKDELDLGIKIITTTLKNREEQS